MSKVLHRAFELRQKGDYVELVDITKDDVDEILPKAKDFELCNQSFYWKPLKRLVLCVNVRVTLINQGVKLNKGENNTPIYRGEPRNNGRK
ncbi:MAG: hypothetical protein QME42_10510 [bacterium]|nr:hypothetical protein [bacterium]